MVRYDRRGTDRAASASPRGGRWRSRDRRRLGQLVPVDNDDRRITDQAARFPGIVILLGIGGPAAASIVIASILPQAAPELLKRLQFDGMPPRVQRAPTRLAAISDVGHGSLWHKLARAADDLEQALGPRGWPGDRAQPSYY